MINIGYGLSVSRNDVKRSHDPKIKKFTRNLAKCIFKKEDVIGYNLKGGGEFNRKAFDENKLKSFCGNYYTKIFIMIIYL